MSASTASIEAPDKEASLNRNPHADFAAVQAARPAYNYSDSCIFLKTPNPSWKVGDGASNDLWKEKDMVAIDPSDPKRQSVQNYKVMISSTVPRPIALVSTASKDGTQTNLAPFSYFQNVSSDPPLYSLSFVGGGCVDTLRHVLESGELCISIISDWFVEAANYTSINSPPEISEWTLSGLTPRPSTIVRPAHVAESAFSIEAKLYSYQEIMSPTTGLRTAVLVIVEAVQWHVRSDAINADKSTVNIDVLRPIWRAGGITYGTSFQAFELPRPEAFRHERKKEEVQRLLENAK